MKPITLFCIIGVVLIGTSRMTSAMPVDDDLNVEMEESLKQDEKEIDSIETFEIISNEIKNSERGVEFEDRVRREVNQKSKIKPRYRCYWDGRTIRCTWGGMTWGK